MNEPALDPFAHVVWVPIQLIKVPLLVWHRWTQHGVRFLWETNGWHWYGNAYLLTVPHDGLAAVEAAGITGWPDEVEFHRGYLLSGKTELDAGIFVFYALWLNAFGVEWCGDYDGYSFFLVLATAEQMTQIQDHVMQVARIGMAQVVTLEMIEHLRLKNWG